jgi:hypothetical protein
METVQLFLSAVFGSLVTDIYEAHKCYHSTHHKLPIRYRHFSFYAVCLLAALAAGCLAVLLPCRTPVQALIVGLAAPKLIAVLGKSDFFKGSF